MGEVTKQNEANIQSLYTHLYGAGEFLDVVDLLREQILEHARELSGNMSLDFNVAVQMAVDRRLAESRANGEGAQ